MSTIEKLLIRGIRSFGPSKNDEAIVSFQSPVTLIVGQNGAGKTTIIECLKYMTTGEFPPNSKGGAFVIDPKLIGEREVKAMIKLKFVNVKGEQVICHRILQSEQKPKKIEQKQLDGSLEKRDKDTGEKVKITSRCTEINTEMIVNLGVSKAILNHVIFCHQEESNWPLSEGKALKTKFDEIFASTRYSKALETIKKFQGEQRHSCNEYTAELKYLKEQKLKAEELRKRLTEAQKTVDGLKAEEDRLSKDLHPLEEKLSHLKKKFEKVASFEKQIATFESSIKEMRKHQESLSSKIVHQFTGSLEELQTLLTDHEHQLERKQKSLEECKQKIARIDREEKSLTEKVNKLSEECGRLESEEQYYQQALKNRDSKIAELASQFSVDGYMCGPFSSESVRLFRSELTEQKGKRERQLNDEKTKLLEREKKMQVAVTELQDNCSRLKQKREMKEKQLQDNEKQLQILNRQLSRIASASTDIERIELDLKQASNELKEYQESVDISQLERELSQLQETKRIASENQHRLQKEMNIITQQSAARGALESMQKDKQSKEQDYQREFGQIESELLSLLGHMPADDELDSSMDEIQRSQRKSLSQVQSKLTKQRYEQSRTQTQMDEKKKQIRVKEEQLKGIDADIKTVCGSVPYEQKLQEVKQEISTKEENITAIKGSQSFFKECLNKARSSKKCPLCARPYDTQEGLNGLITSIERRLTAKVPELIQSYQQQMSQLQSLYNKLLQLTPQLKQAQILRTEEIPSLEKEVNEKTSLLEKLNVETAEAESQLTNNQRQQDQLRELRPRVARLSQLKGDLDQLDRRISAELSKLGGENVRSHAVVHRELQKAQMECDELDRKSENKRQEIYSCRRSVSELEKRVHDLKQQLLNLQKQMQERQTCVVKQEELTTANQGLQRDIQGTDRQFKPLEKRLVESTLERDQAVKEREEKERQCQSELHQFDSANESIQSSMEEISKLEAKRLSGSLEQCKRSLEELNQKLKQKAREGTELNEQREELKTSLANSKVRQRELEDSQELLRIEKEIGDSKKKISELVNQLRELGLDQYNKDFQSLQTRRDQLAKERSHAIGSRLSKEGELKSTQRELNSEIYRNADERFREKSITLKTTQIAIADLDKYYKALDRAIMRFHTLKMDEINKIIKELWLKTYKGGDIDTIEIRSDDDPEGTSSTGRRTYNYRVVMVKGDTVLDMRGRCSAGQKVLASIIIRLALAESFCIHCGLLALDEPTTNLDKENIEGLAVALSDIIRERQHQKNFQLIVITHDYSFVEQLGRSEFVEQYHFVKKDIGCPSSVKQVRITDLPVYS